MNDLLALIQLNANYVAAIDDDRLEDWPECFTEDGFYRVTTQENLKKGRQAGLIYADSQQMLHDRVLSLRKANVYESQRYRHIIGLPRLTGTSEAGHIRAETSFLVMRIVRSTDTQIFGTGRYIDEVAIKNNKALFKSREAIFDSSRLDTLLALPI